MMNLEIFNNQQFGNIRGLFINGEGWLVGRDVAEALGYNEPHKAVQRHVDGDDGMFHPIIDSLGRAQNTMVINESGLYSLVLGSKLPKAKDFRKWVTGEVLPSIRKTGSYHADIPKTLSDALRAYADAVDEKLALEQQIEQDKPRVLFSQAVEASEDSILIGDLAKVIKQNGIDVGQNRLFDWMRDKGYLIKSGASRNMPTQYAMDRGWFEVQQRVIQVPNKDPKVRATTRVTGKGQLYFINKFMTDYQKAQ